MPSRLAPAKINLTLHVTGQRADGYHLLDSLVVFARAGDRITLSAGQGVTLDVVGPMAAGLVGTDDNLVRRAARLIGAQDGVLVLDKHLPLASGMGGGSSDAAAALHLLAQVQGLALPDIPSLMGLGADVPVCMSAPQPARMRGLGERVDAVPGVPALWLLLVNPGQGLSTPAVFKALVKKDNPPMPEVLPAWRDGADLCDWLARMRNDLQPPAQALMPRIGDLLDAIAARPGCRLARMTGSGATCFGIFDSEASLRAAAVALDAPGRYVKATQSLPS